LDKPMPTLMFRGMTFVLRCRDIFRPRERILKEVQIEPRHRVLDFGCGPGSYTIIVAKCVGENGKVYALDIHPLAMKKVQETARYVSWLTFMGALVLVFVEKVFQIGKCFFL
jgi:tRNA A58 N-methylase Trm61